MTPVRPTAEIAGPIGRRISGRMRWLVALLVVVVAVPFVFSNYHVFQATQILVYAIAVLGFNLLTGFSGQISLGNGAFYAIGAYTSAILMTQFHVPYWATLPIAGAVCFGVGFLFGRSATRLEGLYLALATFGLAIALPQILKLDAIEHWTGGSARGGHTRTTTVRPNSPLGRNTRTARITASASACCRWLPTTYAPPRLTSTPTMNPPIGAPHGLSMPPSSAAAKP